MTTPSSAVRATTRPLARIEPYLLCATGAVYIVLLVIVPMIRGVGLSFTATTLLNPAAGQYVGFANYRRLLTSGAFWSSLTASLVYCFCTVAVSVLGTMAAVLINRKFPGRALVRALLIVPWAMPTVAIYLLFRWMYNDSSGVFNRLSSSLGFGRHGWLTDPNLALWSVLVTTIWKVLPFVMLIVLAALQSIPEELYEASRVDGADPLSSFKTVTLPHLRPTIRVVTLLMTIWSFRQFDLLYLLTGGGPNGRTNTLVVDLYQDAFQNNELGSASAIGVIGILFSLAVTVIFFLAERRSILKGGSR